MSTPARKVAARSSPRRKTTQPPSSLRSARPTSVRQTSRAARSEVASPAVPSSPIQKRSRSTLVFVVFTAAVMAVMVLGLVALNAVLAQASFRIDDLQTRVESLSRTYGENRLAVARLSSPARIAKAARGLGMTLPEGGVQVLHVSDDRGEHPARAHDHRGGGRTAAGTRVVGGTP